MSDTPTGSTLIHWKDRLQERVRELTERDEEQVYLVLTLVIGALVGMVVVAFILVTEDLGEALYPEGGQAWRRVLIPVLGALVTGLLLFFSFPDARGSGGIVSCLQYAHCRGPVRPRGGSRKSPRPGAGTPSCWVPPRPGWYFG